MEEKYQYIVFKTVVDRIIHYDVVPVASLVRGLYDWSGGREILGRLDHRQVLDVFIAPLTWDQAQDIQDGKAQPPGRAQRLRDAGMGHLV